MFDKEDFSAPEEGAEEAGESVTARDVATPPEVVKSSTRSTRKPTRRKMTRRKATEKVVAKAEKVSAPKTVAIQLVYSGTVIANVSSGATYRWESPGDIVQVAESDVDDVMKKNGDGTRECCGSSSLPVYFALVD
jgi:hypothetical protein